MKWATTPDDGVRIAGEMTSWNRKHWPNIKAEDAKSLVVYARDPDLKRQAKAREALRKLTKGMTQVVEEDGTEVYS